MSENLLLSHYNIDIESFRSLLRSRREQMGLTQLTLAKRAGVSSATVHKLEAGRLSVHLDLFIRVVNALGLPLGDLISFDGSSLPAPIDPRAIRVAELLKANDQAGILRLLAEELTNPKAATPPDASARAPVTSPRKRRN